MRGRVANALKIRWVRVLIAGVLAEVVVFIVVFPTLHFFGQQAFLASILIASAVMPFLFALWVGRHIDSWFVLHGAFVGLVAALFYVVLTRGQPEPQLYVIAHGLKVIGGAAGGLVAARRNASARNVV
jgi:uncharacterized membrane protein HdeD (DUF308 family)